jgi:hypothetical protein
MLETRQRRFQAPRPDVTEVSQARLHMFRFRAKPHLPLALELSQQSATAKALPLIQLFTSWGGSC